MDYTYRTTAFFEFIYALYNFSCHVEESLRNWYSRAFLSTLVTK